MHEFEEREIIARCNASNNEAVNDNVNRPAHYTDGNIEVWDFIIDQELSYCKGNVVKYVCRAGKKNKDTEIEDLNKAIAYLNREIKRIGV